jgi:hypothetical protein
MEIGSAGWAWGVECCSFVKAGLAVGYCDLLGLERWHVLHVCCSSCVGGE